MDKDTGQPREVDVSLRGKIGSSNILVIIECRDRMKDPPQDATWIEQIACKRDSVGADKVIAVSSKGFTEPAKIKAQKNKIELRTFEDIDLQEIRRWFLISGYIEVIKYRIEFQHVRIHINNRTPEGKKLELSTPHIDLQAQIFVIKKDGRHVSLDYIWSCFPSEKLKELYAGVPEDGSKKIYRGIRLNYPDETDRFQLLTDSRVVDIISIEIKAVLWIETEKVPPTFMKGYKDHCKENGNLAEIQEFEFDTPNKKVYIDFVGSEVSGRQSINVRAKEKQPKNDIL